MTIWHTNIFRHPADRMIHADIPAQEAVALATAVDNAVGALRDVMAESFIGGEYYTTLANACTLLDSFGKNLSAEVDKKR